MNAHSLKAHLYLRASTKDQDALRAKASLEAFASDKNLTLAGVYAENISGTKLNRPELMRLLNTAEKGDVLLVESVDRLSRLSQADWEALKATIKDKGLRLVIADLPTSHMLIQDKGITGQNPGQYSFVADTAEGIYNEAKAQGLTLSEVDKILGAGAGEAEEWAKKMGLPIFHGGTPYVQRTGFAVLQEGEAVVPKALNPWVGGAGGQQSGNAELVAQNQALQAKVEKLEAQLVRVANATERLADQFDNATAGGNAMAVEVME